METFLGILIPFLGTMLGASCVFFMKKSLSDLIQRSLAGFAAGFWQLLVILSVMNLIDRFLIDGYWVGHTNAWTIPGTEDLKPYITAKDKQKKWLCGTVGMAVIAAVLAAMVTAFIH